MTTVKIVSRESVSNGAIAVRFRPNDDEAHDSIGTFYTAGKTKEDVLAWIEKEKERVATEYEAHQTAHAILAELGE